MNKPIIHYDRMLGAHPEWRHLIMEGLKGNFRPLKTELYLLDRGGFTAGARTLSAFFLYAHSGQQTYCLGPRMQGLLHETDLTAVPETFLKLPYQCIYIAFLGSPWKIWGGDRTGWHTVAGVYMSCKDSIISMVIWGAENEKSTHIGDDATFWMTLNLNRCEAKGPPEAQVLDIESQITKQLNTYSADDSDPGMRIESRAVRDRTVEVTESLARVCINLVLYLNSSDPETEIASEGGPNKAKQERLKKEARRSGKKGAKARKRLKAMTEARIVIVGKSIESGKVKRVASRKGGSGVRRPHWRKGHFHPYWVGSRKDASGNPRKGTHQVLKWVEPVFVGDMAEMIRARGTIHVFDKDRK